MKHLIKIPCTNFATVQPKGGDVKRKTLKQDPAVPLCVDCGGPATCYRDVGRAIFSCRPCEDKYRATRWDPSEPVSSRPSVVIPRPTELICPHGCGPCPCGSGDPSCLCWNDHAEPKRFICGCTEVQPCPEHEMRRSRAAQKGDAVKNSP